MAPQFTLYSHKMGPNGWKVAQVLCELGLEYETVMKEFGDGENGMKTPEFEAINPNGRIPALVDHSNGDLTLWESGAIILYLVKKYDPEHKLYPADISEQAIVDTWFFYQMTGFGPYLGQAVWFTLFHPDRIPSATDRYVAETHRNLKVLTGRLESEGSNGWLALGKMTIADLSFLQWVRFLYKININIEKDYPTVFAWKEKMLSREAIQKSTVGEVW
ncbi:glutathione S-transferase [Dipodascopsis tothii]|uniref:glutathione S-transferase n=1 Tax=Dipodascopsis tothii TaxID=44089 RepID=UPI0034CDE6B3